VPVTLTPAGGCTHRNAVALSPVELFVAVTKHVPVLADAVYTPDELTLPQLAPYVTFVVGTPATLAVNAMVSPASSVAKPGQMCTKPLPAPAPPPTPPPTFPNPPAPAK
jgi:hypothetical protein